MVGSLLRLYKKIGTDAKVWHLYRLIKCIETFSAASQLVCAFCAGNLLLSEFELLDRFLQIGCHLRQMLAGRSNLFD